MNINEFQALIKPVTDVVSSNAVDAALAEELNRLFPPGSETFDAIEKACHDAVADGWMCAEGEEGGPRWGRIIEPNQQTGGLSVDVVKLKNWVGSKHRHPKGEVCMILPLTPGALFDDMPRGWCVFEPATEHHPTVSNGEALVLYMLPDGLIDFADR
jgi:hypothetical protein